MIVYISETDIGKPVVRGDETVGHVADVRDGTAYVDPVTDDGRVAGVEWNRLAAEAGTYPLEPFMIAHVHDDRIRLRQPPRE